MSLHWTRFILLPQAQGLSQVGSSHWTNPPKSWCCQHWWAEAERLRGRGLQCLQPGVGTETETWVSRHGDWAAAGRRLRRRLGVEECDPVSGFHWPLLALSRVILRLRVNSDSGSDTQTHYQLSVVRCGPGLLTSPRPTLARVSRTILGSSSDSGVMCSPWPQTSVTTSTLFWDQSDVRMYPEGMETRKEEPRPWGQREGLLSGARGICQWVHLFMAQNSIGG